MPGLLRGVARTAVIAGTATAVSGRVQRRQAERFAQRDAAIYAQREQAYQEQTAPAAPAPAAPAPAPVAPAPAGSAAQVAGSVDTTGDTIQHLKDLAELRSQGILTDEEFAAQKAKILGGS
ncbi:SHOCT domain-containing protein [Phycicoccus sp. M110.8]|uniref:SHOCT domain-containing protein n=1 Tax=Phycicoccus sp. M110.8 TaxID=3075433 RepID=UPI0028FD87B6|nr:SHOCT domain-containing protein [Phycicoccus sp. M110.8]MDU0314162.1 SHOCT domain-containing protein [Phycicoccus sp. M110.8]